MAQRRAHGQDRQNVTRERGEGGDEDPINQQEQVYSSGMGAQRDVPQHNDVLSIMPHGFPGGTALKLISTRRWTTGVALKYPGRRWVARYPGR